MADQGFPETDPRAGSDLENNEAPHGAERRVSLRKSGRIDPGKAHCMAIGKQKDPGDPSGGPTGIRFRRRPRVF